MKELKTGDKIKIKKENLKLVTSLLDNCKSAQVLAKFSAENLRKANDDLWSVLKELHPESKDFRCTYDDDENVIIIGI